VSELHKFHFQGMPVRGMLVRLTEAWQEVLERRAANATTGAYPAPVRALLGEMTAAALLLYGNIKFDGALILQIHGDGPVKLAVVEVQPGMRFRATATLVGEVPEGATLSTMVNQHGRGRCAVTLDPQGRQPGQQPYQGLVPLVDEAGRPLERLAEVLEHYMRQSEQLDTTLVLAADDRVAAGLLIQRLPAQGGTAAVGAPVRAHGEEADDDYARMAMLAKSLTAQELLGLDSETILRRLFWQEPIERFEPLLGPSGPRFGCSCSRERVAQMLRSLGADEVRSIVDEQGQVEVGCEFCGQQYRFDPIEATQLFVPAVGQPPVGPQVQ
jgi:molecular chaperone Hsp33